MGQKLEVRMVKVEDACKNIMKTLAEMNTRLTGMDHVIRGNGSPGLVTKQATQEERLKALEGNKRDWKDFVAAVLGGGLVAIITAIIQHFSR